MRLWRAFLSASSPSVPIITPQTLGEGIPVPSSPSLNNPSTHPNDAHLSSSSPRFMLCDVWHSTLQTAPTFGHILGNTWVHFGFGPGASQAPCNSTPAAWRSCFGHNLAGIVTALQAASPHLLLSGGLMEFITSANLDDPAGFPDTVCVDGTVGQWGDNTTCVPDITKPMVQGTPNLPPPP